MPEFAMTDSASFRGEWWIARQSDSATDQTPIRTPGVLDWKDQRAILELHQALTPLRGIVHAGDQKHYPAIHGTTTQSRLVTMLSADRYGSPTHFGPGGLRETEEVRSSWVILGAHVTAETLYSDIEARIPGLSLWLEHTGATRTLRFKTPECPAGINFDFAGLAEEVFALATPPCNIGYAIGRQYSGDPNSRVEINTTAYVRIKPHEPQTLTWFVDYLNRLSTLHALIAGAPMAADHIAAHWALDDRDLEVLVGLRNAQYCTFGQSSDFFLSRSRLDCNFSAVLSTWFNLYDQIAMPSQLALSVFCSEKLWLHVEFLSLIQALEGLHRAILPGGYMTADAYEDTRKLMCDAIPKGLSSGHRSALKSKIQYGYEFSLRKRLAMLVNTLDESLRRHILGSSGAIPESWVDTRNYYTHWDETTKANVLDGADMHHAGVRLKCLLRALYLNLLGIPQAAILRALQNQLNDESRYLIQLNAMAERKANPDSHAGAIMKITVTTPPA